MKRLPAMLLLLCLLLPTSSPAMLQSRFVGDHANSALAADAESSFPDSLQPAEYVVVIFDAGGVRYGVICHN